VRRGRWTAAPLAGLAMRVALDPYAFTYYGMGPIAAALLWDLTRPRGRLPVWTAATLVVEYLIPLASPYQPAALGRAVWSVAVIALLAARRSSLDPRESRDAADGVTVSPPAAR
jgi:hypothetical protein